MVGRGLLILLAALALLSACSRTRYRLLADRDAYALLYEKATGYPWALPSDFSLHPPPTSRLYDPTPLDDPWLPFPAPQLYAYQLPELPSRSGHTRARPEATPAEESPAVPPVMLDDSGLANYRDYPRTWRLPPTGLLAEAAGGSTADESAPGAREGRARFQSATRIADAAGGDGSSSLRRLPPAPVALAVFQSQVPETKPDSKPATDGRQPAPMTPARARAAREAIQETHTGEILLTPIPRDAWQTLPGSCLMRMLEFGTLRDEYLRSWESEPSPDQFAPGQRLSLEDIVALTLMNSRDYQTQKETLYRVSLRLSLERFAYQVKFSPFNNGTAVAFNTTRTGGTMENGLRIPTSLQIEKALATGGDFLARFANSVVLTFNGPQGFAADVGSDLLLEFNQTVFQRDVRFESLTQAERDVVYAARDFLRFRKSLFVQLASQYYNLIRTYRQVEIDSQNYFTLVRAFHQSTAEYQAGLLPRFQLDQVEQNVLSGRSRVIATCNSLENALDNLKLRMGLPTETHVNVDLGELDQLTARDELAVTGQLIQRVGQRLRDERTRDTPIRAVLLSQSIVLIERMLDAARLQQRLGQPVPALDALRERRLRLRVEAEREGSEIIRNVELAEALREVPPNLSKVFQRRMDLVDSLLQLIKQQMELLALRSPGPGTMDPLVSQVADFQRRADAVHAELDRVVEELRTEQLPQLVEQAAQLQNEVEAAVRQLDGLLGLPAERPSADEATRRSVAESDELLQLSLDSVRGLSAGLAPIQIEMDDAMLTALNLRLDLMNQRGDVADAWRQIKYAGDDLKSVLNLEASHRVSTRRDVNRVFDFTLDESDTRVSAQFDAPLNRRAERNGYRQALIDYQAALRQLMLLEDNIKFAIRNDLRALSLDQEQYVIDVASAALAYERVVSVRLELRLGIGDVAARDFLEAQNAYAASLSSVAGRHIGYIVDRTQLFLDLELLSVDDDGFWNELYDEEYQPEAYYQLPLYGQPVYGRLVPGLWYSRYLRRMEQVPPGLSAIHDSQRGGEAIPPDSPWPDAPAAPPDDLPLPPPPPARQQ